MLLPSRTKFCLWADATTVVNFFFYFRADVITVHEQNLLVAKSWCTFCISCQNLKLATDFSFRITLLLSLFQALWEKKHPATMEVY
jgi:hypothetical protein